MSTAYSALKEKIKALEERGNVTQVKLTKELSDDLDIPWDDIQRIEQEDADQWKKIAKNWKYKVIQRYLTPNRFKNGGDRRSAQWKAKRIQHRALVACVEDRVLQATPDVPESSLVEDCLRTVQQRWRPLEAATGASIVQQTVRVVVTATRRCGQRDGCKYTREEITALRTFEQTEIVERSVPEEPQVDPFGGMGSFNLHELRHYDVTIQAEILRLLANLSKDHTERALAREETERIKAEKDAEMSKDNTERMRLEKEPQRLREERLLLLAGRRPAEKRKAQDHEATVSSHRVHTEGEPEEEEEGVTRLALPGGRRPKLPEGARDLTMELVCGDVHGTLRPEFVPLSTEEYLWLASVLRERFVIPHMESWAVLWAPTPARAEIIPTFLDTANDPIVLRLRGWLRDCLDTRRGGGDSLPVAPVYPVVDDPRPPEAVPDTLQATDVDVWEDFVRVGLAPALARYRAHYEVARTVHIAAAGSVCAERVRQWRRLSAAPALSFAAVGAWRGRPRPRVDGGVPGLDRRGSHPPQRHAARTAAHPAPPGGQWGWPLHPRVVRAVREPDQGVVGHRAQPCSQPCGGTRCASVRCDARSFSWRDCGRAVPNCASSGRASAMPHTSPSPLLCDSSFFCTRQRNNMVVRGNRVLT